MVAEEILSALNPRTVSVGLAAVPLLGGGILILLALLLAAVL